MSDSLKEQYASTPLYGGNANAIEAMYEQFRADPDSVPTGWQDYFKTLGPEDGEVAHSVIREELLQGLREQGPKGYRKFISDYFRRLTKVKTNTK